MFAENISGALSFGDAKAHAGFGKAGAGSVELAVDAFLHAIGDGGLHFLNVGINFVEAVEAPLPFFEFGITEDGVLNDLIALVFAVESGDGGIALRGLHEGAEFGMKERGLCIDVEDRRRGALEAEREAVGVPETGAGHDLRKIVIVELAVGGGGVLLVGGSDGCAVGVLQGEFDGVAEG